MKAVNPYFNFAGNTEEAFEHYKSVFGGEFLAVVRFRDFPGNPMQIAEGDLNKIAHIALPLGNGTVLMGTDVVGSMCTSLTVGNNVHVMLEPENVDEAHRLFDALSAGGRVEMPLQPTEWAEKYGCFVDRFGVQWMVNYTGSARFSPA